MEIMNRIVLLTSWITDGRFIYPNMPMPADGDTWLDVTGQSAVIPENNAVVWEVITSGPSRYDADQNVLVLSSDEL